MSENGMVEGEGATAEEERAAEAAAAAVADQAADAIDDGGARNLELILDIPLEVSVELGRGHIPIHELLQLAHGSVVELSKLAGEPLDILVNRKLVARGEAVVVNEKFGVRLTDIVSPAERIEHLVGGDAPWD